MNEMYDMSIVTHNFGVIGVLGVILVNVLMLLRAKDVIKYKKFMMLFMPVASTMIATIVFTGIIMMAAKHLDFTIENIVMIIFATVFIALEFKKSYNLKYLNRKEEGAFSKYKSYAMNILLIETAMVLSISAWMWA